MLVDLIVMALAVAATSYTIARAKIFAANRKWITRKSKWFGQLVNCPYCVSHWVAAALVIAIAWRPLDVLRGIDYFVGAMAIVCVSAFFLGVLNRAFPRKVIPEPEPEPLCPPPGEIEMWHHGWAGQPDRNQGKI